jgi:DNA-binding transcriptional ArsR family regulator
MIDIDDERSKEIAEILGNNTSKKILGYLSEIKDASEKDISDKLNIPINTIEYNLNKLIKAGLIEKTRNFFWSVKGKKIEMYKLSNKKIIISPRSFLKGIVPSIFAVIFGSFVIKFFIEKVNFNKNEELNKSIYAGSQLVNKEYLDAGREVVTSVPESSKQISNFIVNSCSGINEIWLWFLLGGLFGILIFLIWNSFKHKMKGGF